MSTSHEQPDRGSSNKRPRDEEESLDDERPLQRVKLDEDAGQEPLQNDVDITMTIDTSPRGSVTPPGFTFNQENLLPPSRKFLGLPPAPELPPDGFMHRTLEVDVGISQYIGTGLSQINGIIKQRFTDFMVYEIDMTHNVVHIKSIERPTATLVAAPSPTATMVESAEPWPPAFTEALAPFFSESGLNTLKNMYLEGPKTATEEVLPVLATTTSTTVSSSTDILPTEFVGGKTPRQKQGKGKAKAKPIEDKRKALSELIDSKEQRFQLHKVVRDLFKSKLETFTEGVQPGEIGARIVIKWAGSGPNKGSRRAPSDRDHQPYIHFTLQKTNRDTSDVLAYLARMLKVDGRSLTTAGTKDKRAVTCQRVCLKRGRMTVEEVWDKVNQSGRRTQDQIMQERGERGIRVADIDYRKGHLQLGMLKGNEFLITLRNVKAPSTEAINQSMEVLKTKGFVNYYGMQRFGTASIPTHAIGLALLRSDWAKAIDMILRPRPGETPEIQEARLAWAVEKNLDKALQLMPRRVVAERCILESFQRMGNTRNMLGALSTIPRNLRMMYVHAYQSYVWNAVVSERIRRYGHEKPIVGDIVYEEKLTDGDQSEASSPGAAPSKKQKSSGKKPPRQVKVLTEDDVNQYTIYDVLMPLPGTDVAYPGGELGELYRQFLKEDGLNPSDFNRKQREYSLAGSYRKIVHLPKLVSWSLLRYTDPELPLAQSDEDRILGIEPPQTEESGKFLALQIRLQLGTASYATMALREITKVDTSTHVQTLLTVTSEDQEYKGAGGTEMEGVAGSELMNEVEEAEAVALE
ncbi:hypothetical protein FRB91_000143 [Serendipita sp. 411]|nr:hypothetical protein FRB91_000143 [Serendipita sp. 411]